MILLSELNHFLDRNLLALLSNIEKTLPTDQLVQTALLIGRWLTFTYFAWRAFLLMSGKSFNFLELGRPFVLMTCAQGFNLIIFLLKLPAEGAELVIQKTFEGNAQLTERLVDLKAQKTDSIFKYLLQHTAEIQQARYNAHQSGNEMEDFKAAISSLGTKYFSDKLDAAFYTYEKLVLIKLQMWVQGYATSVQMSIYKGLMYSIFAVKVFLLNILSIICPVCFAVSIAAPYRNAWSSWISKFFGCTFIGVFGYLVLNISGMVLQYGLEQELYRLDYILSQKAATDQFLALVQSTDNYMNFFLISLIISAVCMVAVFKAVSWMMPDSGAGGEVMDASMRSVSGPAKFLVGKTF